MTELLAEKNGPIYTLTLNRPEKRNALPFEMLRDICQKVEDQIFDPEIRGLDMEATLQSILLRSEDFQEGITALMEKRDPVWKRK